MDSPSRSWLRAILEPLRPVFREVVAISLFVNLVALAVPVFTLQVYDRVVYHAGLTTLQGLVIGVVLLLGFDYVLRQARARILQTVALRIDVEVAQRLFDKLMALPLRTLESRPIAFWQTLFRDADTVRNTLSGASAVLAADLPFALIFFATVYIIAPPLGWVFMLALAAFLALALRSALVLNTSATAEQGVLSARDILVAEVLAGRNTVKALALDRAVRPLWDERQAAAIDSAIRRGDVANAYQNLGQTFTMVTTVALTAVGAVYIVDQQLTVGALVATNMLSSRLLGPINQLVGAWRSFTGFRQSLGRLGKLFAEEEERRDSGLSRERPRGRIAVEDVRFTYAEGVAPVIDGVRLTIAAGAMTAIMGRNGSGKTTLLKLMLGLYAPQTGRVLLDGADIAQFTRAELAGWIGYVPQECVLFSGTIRDNIAYGSAGAEDAEVLRAARLAGVDQYIVDLSDGYATQVGEGGARLSAGQRQRIAIARALVGDPAVLLLDEPSSSLDRQAEEDLRGTLQALARDHTVVMVTHSPVLVAACQQAVVLDHGKVAGSGPAADLLNRIAAGARRPAAAEGVPS